jgi:NitT/TauT family transport system substrate-binding protein
MKRRSLIQAVAGAAIVGPLAACNSAKSNAAARGGGAEVTIGFSAWPGWFPWQVAQEKDLFTKNNVSVKLKYFDSYTDSLNALSTGNLSANSQTLNDTLSSVSGGAKQVIVLVNDNSTGNDQIIAAPGIGSMADLKGRKVAAEQGTVDHYLLLLALRKAGLSEKDVSFTPLVTDQAAAAFVAGKVDAVGVFAPFTTTALGRSGSKALTTSADFPGAIPDHLVFTSQFVADHPTEVQAVVQTWFDTLAWIQANKAEATGIMAKRAGVSEADYKSYDAGTTIFTQAQNLEAFASGGDAKHLDYQANQIAQFLVDTKLVNARPALDGMFAPQFVKSLK